jgi:hypothetical protein
LNDAIANQAITDADVQFFDANGYLAVQNVMPPDELDWLRGVYDDMLAGEASGFLDGVFDLSRPYGTTDAPRLGQLLGPERRDQRLLQMVAVANARRIASRLLRVDPGQLEIWSHLIFKAPKSDAETPWHQDEAYWDVHLEYTTVATWLPLDDVDTTNGCLWYVPGSHRRDVLKHRHLGGDPEVHVLEVYEPVDTRDAVPVPLPAGGMVFHHPRSLHHAGVNESNAMRRAWGVVFQTAPRRRAQPVDRPWWHEGHKAHAERFAQHKAARKD